MSDKICLPTEHYFLLMVCFLLITMFYVYNLKNMHNIDFNYGLNNNLATLSEHVRRLDTIPLIQNKVPVKKPLKKKMTKEDALRVLTNENTRITSNNLTELQTEVLENYPELVMDTQPRSLVTENITKDSLLQRPILTNELPILTNQVEDTIEQNKVIISNPIQLESSLVVPDIQKRVALENRDREAVFNDFRAPERRDAEHAYPTRQVKEMINLPTRGLPDNFHSVGVLVRKKDEKVLQLFGRQKYPGSSQWEYYVAGADSYGYPNKMPVGVRGDRELDDKQKIDLPWLDKSKGDFEVNLYNYDVPRYNPFAF
jgi:hypothetical protein